MYRWVDHTAEVELAIEAASEREVFADALEALAELLDGDGRAPADERRTVTAWALDRPALLAAWMEELVFLAESEGFVPARLDDIELGAGSVRATVAGRLGEPPPLVKAVTYHRLSFEPSEHGYAATVVLDV